jgi:hypothetical protein
MALPGHKESHWSGGTDVARRRRKGGRSYTEYAFWTMKRFPAHVRLSAYNIH